MEDKNHSDDVARECRELNCYIIRYADNEGITDNRGDRPLRVVYDIEEAAKSTAAIAYYDGRRISTIDGEQFFLGSPSPLYLEWMQQVGIQFDPENPLDFDRRADPNPIMGPDNDPDNPYRETITEAQSL